MSDPHAATLDVSHEYLTLWSEVLDDTPRVLRERVAALVDGIAAELADIFYERLGRHPHAKLFLDNDLVNQRLRAAMTRWVRQLFATLDASQLPAAIAQLRARRDQLAAPGNDAERLARTLAGTMPLVYGGGILGSVAATRWKAQINQSAKSPAFVGELPGVVHDELAGWGQHGDVTRQVLSLVLLRHDEEPPAVSEQFGQVELWTDEVMSSIHTVRAEGDGALAQLLDLAFFGDVVALDLAALYGIDPGPTVVINPSPVLDPAPARAEAP